MYIQNEEVGFTAKVQHRVPSLKLPPSLLQKIFFLLQKVNTHLHEFTQFLMTTQHPRGV